MAGNPYFQDVDAQFTPPAVTPADSPSSPSNFAMVTPHGRGPAPYDLQAPDGQGEIDGAFATSFAEGAAGVLHPMSPRIAAAKTFLSSPQGFGSDGFDIMEGYHGGGGGSWPADVEPDVAGP